LERWGAVTEQADCYVCRKHRGEEAVPGGPIYEGALIYASHVRLSPDGRAYLGWCVVEPRRHAPGLADLRDAEAQAIGLLVSHLSCALKEELHAEHVYAFVLGDHVPHLHVHVVPRHPGAPQKYWGIHVDEWPEVPTGNEAEIAELVTRLRVRLAAEMDSLGV
jgi:histidine triad (HIT) family protein